MKKSKLQSWIIYVPAAIDGKKCSVAFHNGWDDFVKSFSGGLTIHREAKGKWVDGGITVTEKMIPVEIACTRKQIETIIDFTIGYYLQDAVKAKKISDEVIIKYAK